MKTQKGFVGFIVILILVLCCCCVLSMCGLVNIGSRSAYVNRYDPRWDQNYYPKNN